MSASRKDEIVTVAEAVAEKYGRNGLVDPERIIRAKRISLSYGHYAKAFDGMLEHLDGRFHIYCNLDRGNDPGSPRTRFTLAHELGHYFIEDHRNILASNRVPPHPSFSETTGDLIVEREADIFASNLLMPPLRFKAAASKEPENLYGVQAIAIDFQVSLTCAAFRYITDASIPCVIVKWSPEAFEWHLCSNKLAPSGMMDTIKDRNQVSPTSSTGQCFVSKNKSECVFSTVADATFWFSTATQKRWKDVIFKEEAIALGRFGYLTMLSPADSKSD